MKYPLIKQIVLFLSLAAIIGCGDEGPQRSAVFGTVSLDGVPLNNAAIVFIPEKETKGPKAKALINEGQYHLDEDHGPLVGNMRVEIVPVGIEEAGFQRVRVL